MRKLIAGLIAAVIPLSAGIVQGAATETAAAAVPQTWGQWEAQAFAAVAQSMGTGPLTRVETPSSVVSTKMTTASGNTIVVSQRTEVAAGATGNVVLNLSLFGGEQLVVTVTAADGSGDATTLVLDPATSTVSQAVETSATRLARPNAPGGCYPAPYAPSVVGSVFGPLIAGPGVIACPYSPESLNVLSAVYKGWLQVGNQGTGGTYGTFLAVNAYAPCYTNGSINMFETSEVWWVNGVEEGGATSGGAWLWCR